MINRYVLYISSNTISGYYAGRKKLDTKNKIVPEVIKNINQLGIKIYST